jgi:hypothetical protein
MKRHILLLPLLLAFSMSTVSAEVPKIRFLFVGNSYSFRIQDDLKGFFNSTDSPFTLATFSPGTGGSSISGNLTVIDNDWIPTRGEFDYIVLQEKSGRNRSSYNGIVGAFPVEAARGDNFYDIYKNNFDLLQDYNSLKTSFGAVNDYCTVISEQSPGNPKLLIYSTWGYRGSGSATFVKENQVISEGEAKLANERGIPSQVTPVGNAFEYLLENGTFVDADDLYDSDGTHPGTAGKFLAAALFLQTALDDRDSELTLSDFDYRPAGISVEQRDELIAAAKLFSVRPQSYDTWVQTTSLSGDDALPDAIPFEDGVENILKYAFNMNAGGADHSRLIPGAGTAGLPALGITSVEAEQTARFEFLRRKRGSVDYTLLQSSTLSEGSWTPASGTESVSHIDIEWERVTMDAPVAENPNRMFYKIGVSPLGIVMDIDNSSSSRIRDSSYNGSGNLAQFDQALAVGALSWGPALHAGIAFQMTGASAADLLAADFSISLSGQSGAPDFNVDVYASRVSADGTILASDYQASTLLMADFVTTSSTSGTYSLDATGQSNLLAYLESNWLEGSYMIITLKTSPVATSAATVGDIYNFGGATASGVSDNAKLHVTIALP